MEETRWCDTRCTPEIVCRDLAPQWRQAVRVAYPDGLRFGYSQQSPDENANTMSVIQGINSVDVIVCVDGLVLCATPMTQSLLHRTYTTETYMRSEAA